MSRPRPAARRSLLATLVLVAAGLLALDPRPAEGARDRRGEVALEVELTVELSDGSRIVGRPVRDTLGVTTSYGELSLPLGEIRSLNLRDAGARVTLEMRNGDRLDGAVDAAHLELDTLLGRLMLPLSEVDAVQVRAWPEGLAGLVLYYPLDGPEDGRVPDHSGLGNHGEARGLTWVADGRVGGAARFDGQDDHIDCGTDPSLQLTGALSYAAWFRTEQVHEGAILGRRTRGDTANDIASHLTFRAWGGLSAGIVGPTFAAGTGAHLRDRPDLADGAWHHVASVYEPGERLSLYVDGELVDEVQDRVFDSLNPRLLPVRVGSAHTKFYFRGDLDEVMVFDRALEAEEIRRLARRPGG